MFQPHLADPISPINTSSRAFRLRAVKRLEFTNAVKARAPVMIRRRKNEAYPREETRTELLELWVLVLMVFSSTNRLPEGGKYPGEVRMPPSRCVPLRSKPLSVAAGSKSDSGQRPPSPPRGNPTYEISGNRCRKRHRRDGEVGPNWTDPANLERLKEMPKALTLIA